jgi:pterin-4a-carbinolamine dehydratase
MAFAVIHDGNPQHGGPVNSHDRKMKDDEFEDFMRSVKGWTVLESGAMTREFNFAAHHMAYDWMGRTMAFAYNSDRYPKIHWHKDVISATIYSGKFGGITSREARLAAFMSDQFFLIKRAHQQKDYLLSQQDALHRLAKTPPLDPSSDS